MGDNRRIVRNIRNKNFYKDRIKYDIIIYFDGIYFTFWIEYLPYGEFILPFK